MLVFHKIINKLFKNNLLLNLNINEILTFWIKCNYMNIIFTNILQKINIICFISIVTYISGIIIFVLYKHTSTRIVYFMYKST